MDISIPSCVTCAFFVLFACTLVHAREELACPVGAGLPVGATFAKSVTTSTAPAEYVQACFKHPNSLSTFLQSSEAIIVDVRSATRFAEAHLKGAFNIPLNLIATRSFLSSAPLLLIGGEGDIPRLAKLCAELRFKRGQDVYVEKAGIYADWAKGRLRSDSQVQPALGAISVSELMRASKLFRWKIFVVADEVPSGVAGHEVTLISPDDGAREVLRKLSESLDESTDRILLVDGGSFGSNINNFIRIEPKLLRFLDGGLSSYRDYAALRSAEVVERRSVPGAQGMFCADEIGNAG